MAYDGLTGVTSVARLGLWFWGIQLARGVLAVLPIILTLRIKRSHAAIALAS